MSRSTIAHLTLATRDVPRSSAFFTRTLGWEPIRRPGNIRPGNTEREAAWLRIAPGQELHLLEVADFAISDFEREFGRHIAIEFPVEDFDALRDRLLENGAELIDAIRPTPFARFFFRDPNGYVFEVVEAGHEAETE